MRAVLAPPMDNLARAIDRPGLTPDRITVVGLVLGLGSALAAGLQLWVLALLLWLTSRLCDGLDGSLARHRARRAASGGPVDDHQAEAGGFLDITADFLVYGATVVGVAMGVTAPTASGGYDASWLPFAAVLLAYYVNGTAFLAFSSVAERTGQQLDDGRSFSFLAGLAEGTETIAVHSLWLIVPFYAEQIAWVWAAVVAISGAQRMVGGYRTLRRPVARA
ncbi:MAG: CDP-alcohol phosphatidyltransferase family protein [Ornithinimicrobium sp.]